MPVAAAALIVSVQAGTRRVLIGKPSLTQLRGRAALCLCGTISTLSTRTYNKQWLRGLGPTVSFRSVAKSTVPSALQPVSAIATKSDLAKVAEMAFLGPALGSSFAPCSA
jgi:hypothetical protein